jgi:hypothetical protein
MLITEGFPFAWRSEVQNEIDAPGSAVGATQIRVTVSGLASGVTATVSAQTSGSGTLAVTGGGTVTSSANTVTFTIANSNPNASETLQVNFTFTAPTSTPSVGSVTATATMAPIGNAHNADDTLITTAGTFPRFAAAEVGPVTLANIVAAATNLLVPFAVRDLGFDTGIALSNTTADPFGAAGGGATPTAGAIVLTFFPRAATGGAGTSFSLTTSATARPGLGLSADGTLAAGATWTVLLSELLTSAGQTGPFTGYIFIRADFLGAHGAPFVSDFRNFTSFSPMLVMPQPLARGAVEELGL